MVQAQYSFKSWTTDEGLPQNSVLDISQTSDGYLWLATGDGLVRFDGLRFTVFNKINSPGISSNRFLWLHEDASGDLWASTEDGGVIRYHEGHFTSYGLEAGLTTLKTIYLTDDAGTLLVFLMNGDIMRWADGRFVPAEPPTNSADGTTRNPRESRRVPCPKVGAKIYCLLRKPVHTWTLADGLPSLNLSTSDGVEDQQGTLWLATADAGLVRIDGGRVTKVYTERDGLPGRPLFLMPGERPGLFSLDREGALWLSELGNWRHKLIGRDVPSALTKLGDATTVHTDQEGNIWFGTLFTGLFRASPRTVTTYSTAEGLTQNNVYPIFEDREGIIWIGTTKGLFRYAGGKFALEQGMGQGHITAIAEDHAGRLLVANYNEIWIKEAGRFRLLYKKDTGVIWTIYAYDDGALWFGWDQGLIRYVDAQTTTYTTKDGLAGDDVKVIIKDPAGGFWLGTYGGLSHYRDGQFTSWQEQDGLPSRHVRSLYRDADGVLWVGTYDGGLGRFKDGKFTRYTENEGLFNNGIFQILEDGRGQFWMSSNRGIYRVSKRDLDEYADGRQTSINSVAFGKLDGMLSAECNGGRWPAGLRARDGRLWFPTQDGVAVISPASIIANQQPPPVRIESFLIERAHVAFENGVRIQPGDETFDIGYTALSYINSENLRFRYRLEGLDQRWVEAGTRRTAYYTHVPPGSYVFRVIAANSDGVWNTEGAAVRITVLPRFYRTWWFLSLSAACVVGLAVALYLTRVNRLEKARAAQEEFSRKLLASQEEERQRIAAALHDTLGQSLLIIKNRTALARSDIDEGEAVAEQLDEISHSASSAIEECREISYNLRPYHLKRFGLSQTLEDIFLRLNEVTEIRATVEVDPVDDLFTGQEQIGLYRIVQECVNNIIKHSHATAASLSVKRERHGVTLLIEDNGRGFIQAEGDSDANGRGGFGLLGIAERVKMLRGNYEILAEQGTRIRITIPTSDET